jgi:hypothetical protein
MTEGETKELEKRLKWTNPCQDCKAKQEVNTLFDVLTRLSEKDGFAVLLKAIDAQKETVDPMQHECPDCNDKQETIDKLRDTVQMANNTADYLMAKCDRLRKALVGVIGGGDDDWLDSIACQVKNGKTLYIRELVALTAIDALRETMP